MENMALHFMRSINLSSSYKESNKAKKTYSCKYALQRLPTNGLAKSNVDLIG